VCMRPVEPLRPRAGNPGASRCVGRNHNRHHRRHHHRHLAPRGAGASAATARRGQAGRAETVGIGVRSRAAQHRAPGAGTAGCSSGYHGRSGCTARPGRGNARTGTAALEHPCAPRSRTEGAVLDGRVPASHTLAAPPYSARCRARHGRPAAKRWTAAAPDYFGIVAGCTARGSASVTGAARNGPFRTVSATLQGRSITTCSARLPADQPRGFACMAALRAAMQAKNSSAQLCRQATIA